LGGLLGNVPDTDASAKPTVISGRLLGGPYFVHLEASDKKRARRAAATAFDRLPSGQTKIWRNPENGHWGTLTPTRTYVNADGRYCRDYDQTVTLGGQEYQANGTVCHDAGTGKGPAGGWRVVS
jgi:surface antigen